MASISSHHDVPTDAHDTDPALLRENSRLQTFETRRFSYQSVRVFFREHVRAEELPAPLPLVVCIPGLGGSVAQFHSLLNSLVDLAPCLAADWPGCGRSDYALASWEAYTSKALLELLEAIIETYRDSDGDQSVILIGHSMGTAMAAWLANTHVEHTTRLADHVIGLVAICPLSGPGIRSKCKWDLIRTLVRLPECCFSLWRAWDGIGGPFSSSVTRFVGQDAEAGLRQLQYRFNQQSRTPVWRRMAHGFIPVFQNGRPVAGALGLDIWAGLNIPVFLIGGQDDKMTPPSEIDKIFQAMRSAGCPVSGTGSPEHESAGVSVCRKALDPVLSPASAGQADKGVVIEDTTPADSAPRRDDESSIPIPPQLRHPPQVVQKITMPSPANHALLYMPRSARALAGLISDFLSRHVTARLSLAWQLQYLSREGKWDVKNLDKWQSVTPVSKGIGPEGEPIFRAMKTLREADKVHCPRLFAETWGSSIKDVIDISKDQPVYDPRGLERSGIHYHKFPTVSKVPPQAHEVDDFVRRVDGLREAQLVRAQQENWQDNGEYVIGVHCHYGYNRTGYLIVCYLVERCGFGVADAINAFARARPNGIRHSHFLDRLYVRYNVDAARAP